MLYFGLHWSEQLRVAPGIELTDEQEVELTRLSRSKRTSVRLAQRAQIVLLAAQGFQNKDIAEQLGIGRVQVARWRERYLESGLQGIERDLPRGAPPVKVDVAKFVELTTQTTPEAATHWSTRKMAAVLALTPSTAPILRVLQCVAASGVVCVVSSTSLAASTFTGGAPRGRSRSMPCSPDSK